MKQLQFRNLQRNRTISVPWLGCLTATLLGELLRLSEYQLAVQLVSVKHISRLNEEFLNHIGPTDVITFDYSEKKRRVSGEIYICVKVAEGQAEEFATTWQGETVRYLVHGVLHLIGYDDRTAVKRRVMKREENRLVKALEQRFDFASLGE